MAIAFSMMDKALFKLLAAFGKEANFIRLCLCINHESRTGADPRKSAARQGA
jgi:hypothetical protein